MRILLTGATGLLGRNILFDLLKRNLTRNEHNHIIIIGRGNQNIRLSSRIHEIIRQDGINYFGKDLSSQSLEQILSFLEFIECDLTNEESSSLLEKKLTSIKSIDWLIHAAAFTSFQSSPIICKHLEDTNIQGTLNLIEGTRKCSIGTACFIGSAYSCGIQAGHIPTGFSNFCGVFRNPYEKTKLIAEKLFYNSFKRSSSVVKVVRVSTLCGRLHEKEVGATSKFDVIYEFGSYILYRKLMNGIPFEELYERFFDFPVSIPCNNRAGLNIIPVDIAAKSIICILSNIPGNDYYHVCSEKETPHSLWMKTLAKTLNVNEFKLVDKQDSVPQNKEDLIFRRLICKIFEPYVHSAEMTFCMENSKKYVEREGLLVKSLSSNDIERIFSYARKHYFGLLQKPSSRRLIKATPSSQLL